MKKQYISPELQVVHLSQADLIATSGPGLGSDFSDTGVGSLVRGFSDDFEEIDDGDFPL